MLENTFCHIKGIGPKSEQKMWAAGILSWDDVMSMKHGILSPLVTKSIIAGVSESVEKLEMDDARFFCDMLLSTENWRIFSNFRHSVAYIDIETIGQYGSREEITTIAMYDGSKLYYYIKGHNHKQFAQDIERYELIVTYNGKCFDLPVIRRLLGIRMDQAHIDLRFVLHSLGFRGGLKGCEKQLGIDREELDGLDGYFAILLWQDYVNNHNHKALDTLLAYNILDAVNLEPLMVKAYNMKLEATPFESDRTIQDIPTAPTNPFEPDLETVDRLRSKYLSSYY
ncbi:MAG: ribonuclease H-like domain-containing protein [Desulfomonilaceae bacterium]